MSPGKARTDETSFPHMSNENTNTGTAVITVQISVEFNKSFGHPEVVVDDVLTQVDRALSRVRETVSGAKSAVMTCNLNDMTIRK